MGWSQHFWPIFPFYPRTPLIIPLARGPAWAVVVRAFSSRMPHLLPQGTRKSVTALFVAAADSRFSVLDPLCLEYLLHRNRHGDFSAVRFTGVLRSLRISPTLSSSSPGWAGAHRKPRIPRGGGESVARATTAEFHAIFLDPSRPRILRIKSNASIFVPAAIYHSQASRS
jgi:hypothetical protein